MKLASKFSGSKTTAALDSSEDEKLGSDEELESGGDKELDSYASWVVAGRLGSCNLG